MKSLNLGVIGCGRIGKMHVNNIITAFPQVRIKAIADEYPDSVSAWAADRDIKTVSKDLSVVLHDQSIDAVLIAASSSAHVDLIKQAAQAGKHIFCEKPIAFTREKIQEAITAAEKAGVKLQVGLNRRFDPDFVRVKETVAKGEIGNPHIVKITNRDPKRPDLNYIPHSGGLFLDFNVHDFDTARFVTAQEVEEVYALGAVLVDPKIGELGDIDTATITLKMRQGTLGVIDTSREAVYGYDQRVEVFGSKGVIQADNLAPTNTRLASAQGIVSDKLLYSFVERYAEAYKRQLGAFFDCVASGNSPAVTAHDVMQAVTIAIAAKLSFTENRPVKVAEVV